jgi:hypothetical protein
MPDGTIDSKYSILMLRGVMGLAWPSKLPSSCSRVVLTAVDPNCRRMHDDDDDESDNMNAKDQQ